MGMKNKNVLFAVLGIPFGSSPISPLSCAPTGLKYLSIIISHELSDA